MNDKIRVFITDDHAIVRKGIKAILELVPDMDLVGEAGDGIQAVNGVAEIKPDVVLMDLVMPRMDGIEAIKQIKRLQPDTRILVLTTFAGEEKIVPAIKAGALGYHLKDSEPEELVEAIRQVYQGESSLHPRVARKVLQELVQPEEKPPTADPLTQRELEVLRHVANGMENPEIAGIYALREGLASLDGEN